MSRLFDGLCSVLEKHSGLVKEARFVFVSGNESFHGSSVLPYPRVLLCNV